MQRRNFKNEFDEELILWCRAVVSYCKKTCTKSTAILSLIKDVDNCKYFVITSWCVYNAFLSLLTYRKAAAVFCDMITKLVNSYGYIYVLLIFAR